MAKTSMIAREVKRAKAVARHEAKRKLLKKVMLSQSATYEEKITAQETLQKLPRDSSKIRMRLRCGLTGRPRGYYRKFGLGRNKLREAMLRGEIPGLVKASW